MNNKTNTRRFIFDRIEDVSGVSGIGIVADGVLFQNGFIVLSWRTNLLSLETWTSIDDMMKCHGHNGKTQIIWIENE